LDADAIPKEIFSVPSLPFRVLRTEHGGFEWQGTYEGMEVTAVELLEDDTRCLILLDLVATRKSRFENLLCIDASGQVLWKGQLPQGADAFVSIRMSDGLYANTWSGYRVRLDPATGVILEQQFVK
jgi:hypothetical protein